MLTNSHMTSDSRAVRSIDSERAFVAVASLLFVASTATTVLWCYSMSAMGGMRMPGGWMMSMAWMRMPGQTWLDFAASFLGMWLVMMIAMMLPSLLPMLRRYREAIRTQSQSELDRLTALVTVAYFVMWTVFGLIAFAVGVTTATIAMQVDVFAQAAPLLIGIVVVLVGALQFTAWKARSLACCRHSSPLDPHPRTDARTAWRYGLRIGRHCIHCCAGLTMLLLVTGVMDLLAMAVVMTAISFERLAPGGERIARVSGAIAIVVGVLLIVRASGIA